MKAYPLFLYLVINSTAITAQNTGIGTTAPQAKLDIVKSFRVGGASSFLSYDSVGGRFNWSNAHLFVPSNQSIIKHSASGEGLYYINQQLEYRNQFGTPMFATNWNTGNAFFIGNLGIGVTNPSVPLQFPNSLGEKIIFFGDAPNANYGIGIQSYQLQIHGDGNLTDISFGYGRDDDFHENMRITPIGSVTINGAGIADEAALDVRKGSNTVTANFFGSQNVSHFNYGVNEFTYLRGGKTNAKLILNDIPGGKVGFGIEPTIADGIMDVTGGIRIRSGGPGGPTAGVWLNKMDNSGPAAFIGMENDNYTGFYGARGAGWGFVLNGQSGALKINGFEGTAGQVIQSNGAGAPTTWATPTNNLANNVITTTGTIPLIAVNGGAPVDIPGMTQLFNVSSASAKIIVSYDLYIKAIPCFLCGNSDGIITVVFDGTIVSINSHDLINGRDAHASGVFMLTAASGNHTIKLMGSAVGTGVQFSCNPCSVAKRMVIQIINQ